MQNGMHQRVNVNAYKVVRINAKIDIAVSMCEKIFRDCSIAPFEGKE